MIPSSYNECVDYILEIPKMSGKQTDINGKQTDINGRQTDINGKQTDINGKQADISGKQTGISKHTLADIREFLLYMGDPGMDQRFIHVAGTNGKGSVCAYLQYILAEAGITSGMFTSPHLVTMRERIMIGDKAISEEEFVAAFQETREGIQRFSQWRNNGFHPTFFEFLFLMAMKVFAGRKTEYIILETGLGGRLDATNVITGSGVCVITPVGYDHMEYLGDTLEDIAGEKAGIMKPGVPTVIWEEREEVTRKLLSVAGETGCPVFPVRPADIKINEIGNKTIDFSFHSRYDRYVRLCLSTQAVYQTGNAAMAVRAAELLGDERITREAVRDGLYKTHWPGRMEEIGKGIFLDGAHNEDGIRAFLDSVSSRHCRGSRYLMYGGVRDKQYRRIVDELFRSGLFAETAAVPLDNSRSLTMEELKEVFDGFGGKAAVYEDAGRGFSALRRKKKEDDMIYITGSLYLVGQIKRGKEIIR